MFINYVKEYLNNGHSLDDLKKEFGIDSRIYEDKLVIFSYSQIDSPKTNPIVRMCRGLILEKDSWKVINYPFNRFYNFEEVPEERVKFNWDKAVATTKIDGSLISVFNYKNKWNISTRSMIGGTNCPNDYGMDFNKIFDEALKPYSREEFFSTLDPNFTYIFELVSPYNIIITPYDKATLFCIGGRDNNLQEYKFSDIFSQTWENNNFKNVIQKPNIIPLCNEDGSFKGFEEMKILAESVGTKDEGFVVTDFTSHNEGNFPRVKVKNSAYVALHHLKGQIDDGAINFGEILSIVYKNEQDEVVASLPQYKNIFNEVTEKWNKFKTEFNNAIKAECFEKFWLLNLNERKDPAIKKEFALIVQNGPFKKFSSFLFGFYNKNYKNLNECLESNNKNIKDVLKDLWEKFVK